jgi:RNA polymerase sigma-70 factor, ECF subfamily
VDEAAFTAVAEQYRGELRAHCYRMLGSYDEAEDLVQETYLRAWKKLDTFEGRSTVRAWLYRIATNACLDFLDGSARRVLPSELFAPAGPDASPVARTDIAWLQPYPHRPDDAVVERETIELAFLAAIQHLPPRQRAVLILRDVVGWPARDVAGLLDGTVASVNSALQRARATLRERLPQRRLDWSAPAEPTADEVEVLRRYMAAVEAADLDAVADLLAEDVRTAMPPYEAWFAGRDAVLAALSASWAPDSAAYVGRFRMVPVRANGQPGVAAYLRGPGEQIFTAFAIGVLRIEAGRIADLTAFHDPGLFAAFGLPPDR